MVEIACSLTGGEPALRRRVGQWRAVAGGATARCAVSGGVALTYRPDQAAAVELARLAAAEVACCPFFVFTLTVDATGVRFTATAPPEGQELLAAVLGEG
ncbi:hypothetical protein [Actinophytocola xanthii]|uniref:Uncharacterized protein n=1 Tax=Actinophytocola xanthii TaxID=1912961 RepID=A0A1Q8CGN9_9PSEU|nr:hypothetical protein [Actinophytocola xanthii]OLF13504.1 hypothetical protein BU204_26710 [Actinophytocola xanthii]